MFRDLYDRCDWCRLWTRGWCRCSMRASWSWWSQEPQRLIWETGGTTPSTEEVTTRWQVHYSSNKLSVFMMCPKLWENIVSRCVKFLIYGWNLIRMVDCGLSRCLSSTQDTFWVYWNKFIGFSSRLPWQPHRDSLVLGGSGAIQQWAETQIAPGECWKRNVSSFYKTVYDCVYSDPWLKCLCCLSSWPGRPVSRTKALPPSGAATDLDASV